MGARGALNAGAYAVHPDHLGGFHVLSRGDGTEAQRVLPIITKRILLNRQPA
jgi:hypothetical protein